MLYKATHHEMVFSNVEVGTVAEAGKARRQQTAHDHTAKVDSGGI